MRSSVPALVLISMLVPGAASLAAQAATPKPAAGSALVRVFVHTDDTGEPNELAARQASTRDLASALASKKKVFIVVTDEDQADTADIAVEVISRGLTVPRVVIGMGARPGDPPGGNAPLRVAVLRVRMMRGNLAADFTNKNRPSDNPRGWKAAADDIGDQIEKWIRER